MVCGGIRQRRDPLCKSSSRLSFGEFMTFSEKLVRCFSRGLTSAFALLGRRKGAVMQALVSEQIVPVWTESLGSKGALRFWAPAYKPLYRGWSVLSKEPDTIAWIDLFEPASVFWDVGANVGAYSLYAAKATTHTVLAFEPLASNYHVLNRNIEENGLGNRVAAYCMALSDRNCIDYLNIKANAVGSSHHQFGQTRNYMGEPFEPIFRQGTVGFPIDRLIEDYGLAFPNYIKIDVDGIEARIIEGASRTLSDRRLRGLLIESQTENEADHSRLLAMLAQAGFRARQSRRQNFIFDREQQ